MAENVNHALFNGGISATINANGAELVSLKNGAGLELLWQAGPVWPRHAPILFPIVGRLKNDELRHRDKMYPMTQHGFARDQKFTWTERATNSCTLVLTDDAETRLHFPFAFRLAVSYAVAAADLEVRFTIANTGEETLPASIGAHPAFKWPLLPEIPKEAYVLEFAEEERGPVRRLKDGLLRPKHDPTPIMGKSLSLSDWLFTDDAIILDRPSSRAVRYTAPHGPAIDLSWQGFKELGIWSKPGGAPFLCIEPWHGFASPLDFDGEFSEKPGLMHIAPSETRILRYRIRVE
jgi:galactose mutarotase-like enzyme